MTLTYSYRESWKQMTNEKQHKLTNSKIVEALLNLFLLLCKAL